MDIDNKTALAHLCSLYAHDEDMLNAVLDGWLSNPESIGAYYRGQLKLAERMSKQLHIDYEKEDDLMIFKIRSGDQEYEVEIPIPELLKEINNKDK